ncbi:MAG: beta-methylgalactoside transporter [Oscillospiraceae bacterium]|nr:beta-methylgalactoside transporter [Oscillospiraceae bacterium]MBQ3704229.1 beta-methylgalactoside transporter [Oscillospiraceae bacterium]
MNNNESFGKKFIKYVKANPIVVMLVIVAIIVGFTKDNFFSWKNFGNLMSNTAVRFLIALGVSGCLITKGTDLSAGRQAGLAACLTGILIQRADYSGKLWKAVPELNMFIVLLIVVAIGAALGLLNGAIITLLKVPPFIATLGTQTIVYGICLVVTDAQPIGGFQKSFIDLINGRIGNSNGFHLPYLLFVAAIFGLLFWFLYNKMRHGKYMYAIGGNEVAAEVSGVNTTKTLMLIYTTAGVMYAIAGWLLAGKTGGASTSMGMGYELEAIAACTIGGVSTTGGIGTVSGVLVGVLVFELLKIVLQFLGVNPYYNYIVQGIVIVVAVALDVRKYLAKK